MAPESRRRRRKARCGLDESARTRRGGESTDAVEEKLGFVHAQRPIRRDEDARRRTRRDPRVYGGRDDPTRIGMSRVDDRIKRREMVVAREISSPVVLKDIARNEIALFRPFMEQTRRMSIPIDV